MTRPRLTFLVIVIDNILSTLGFMSRDEYSFFKHMFISKLKLILDTTEF